MTENQNFKVGDLVTPKPEYRKAGTNRGYRVTKVNPKNLVCEPLERGPNVRGLSYPAYALQPYDPAQTPAPRAVVTEIEYHPPLDIGAIVTLNRPYKSWTTQTPCVVIADKSYGGGRVNVARLGGEGSEEYLRVPRGGLTVRDLAWLKEVL